MHFKMYSNLGFMFAKKLKSSRPFQFHASKHKLCIPVAKTSPEHMDKIHKLISFVRPEKPPKYFHANILRLCWRYRGIEEIICSLKSHFYLS